MLSTQRFDFHLNHVPQDSESKMRIYHNLIRRVTNRSVKEKIGPQIVWVANSPFEIKYSEEKLGEKLPVRRERDSERRIDKDNKYRGRERGTKQIYLSDRQLATLSQYSILSSDRLDFHHLILNQSLIPMSLIC